SCMNLVRTIATNYRLPFFTISPTFSVCPKHGYLSGEYFNCPKCAAEEKAEIAKKIEELENKKKELINNK
ncbi:MAG: anaerobic ribonucleoside-triphosphate reductase, partial [Spirochaetales bacterium]|nr:anaerobic ribonucleoside-triphosphate reductase [Spirochaetales bacterium]